jgi:hypothetical protein
MGNEAKCTVVSGGKRVAGKALLETTELIFRSDALKLKIPFAAMKSVKAADGELRVEAREGKYAFVLGPAAEKWAQKILHPKSRLEKLGVEEGMKVIFIGKIEEGFEKELTRAGASVVAGTIAKDTDCIFLSAETIKELERAKNIAKVMRGAMALWIVYPKGRKEITENDVLRTGRAAGLKDVKVVGFSATHTALKFVVPVEKR